MKIVFVNEDGTVETVEGDLIETYDRINELTCKQPRHSGFISAVDDTGRVRGSIQVHEYRGKFRNLVFDFVRKFKGLEVIEVYAAKIRALADK